MKITNIYPISQQILSNNKTGLKNKHTDNPIEKNNNSILFAYQDYNISFTGRTPEDFYAQDFNRNNMPQTMKDYLDYDYETRQHIPPEQMMNEVFKYIDIADNFSDVKYLYSKEPLFQNLHENTVKSRKGILSEIKVARELSDKPLLKDGSDDFGMYLLKKIYQEGKTLKEISKDFLEKDINEEYKGFITEPVKYSTLEAYGISYPNTAFWNSFINTRDEYKKFFVTLPKDTTVPGVNVGKTGSTSGSSSNNVQAEQPKKHTRKFHIKQHRKDDIKKDLIEKKAKDIDTVKKTVVKRFGKDDPEASFIVKYMSPIMTVAAERAHMSEEMKAFNEFEQANGKVSNGKTMFERFWKYNPKMLEVFSSAVGDSIDMFEDIYGEGGMIPINTDLERVTKDSKNPKIIDFVSEEFLDLLSYTQSIEPLRNERYAKHDELQNQWDEHFLERYGALNATDSETVQEESTSNLPENRTFEEILSDVAQQNDAGVYKLKTINGSDVFITSDLDGVLDDEIKRRARFLPSRYAAKYIKATRAMNFSDAFKLTLAASKTGQTFDDEQLLSREEFKDEYFDILKFHYDNFKDERAARFAVLDTVVKDNRINVLDAQVYDTYAFDIDEDLVQGADEDRREYVNILKNSKKLIDNRYDYYTKPLTGSEAHKIEVLMLNMISKFDSKNSVLDNKDVNELISMLKEVLPYERNSEIFKMYLGYVIDNNPYTKTMLQKDMNDKVKQVKFELIMDDLMHILMVSTKNLPNIITIFNQDTYNRHRNNLSSELQNIFNTSINKMSYDSRLAFLTNGEQLPVNSGFGFKYKSNE